MKRFSIYQKACRTHVPNSTFISNTEKMEACYQRLPGGTLKKSLMAWSLQEMEGLTWMVSDYSGITIILH